MILEPVTSAGNPSVLIVTATDIMPWVLLRSWIEALISAGMSVHLACSDGVYVEKLRKLGLTIHLIPLKRRFNPLVHIWPTILLTRLILSRHFSSINTHGPVASAVGRVAARIAGNKTVVTTVHGFYFHEDMFCLLRWAIIAIEWMLGYITTRFLFVSDEDRKTALRLGIARRSSCAATIWNGVDIRRFSPDYSARNRVADRSRDETCVVGMIGRIVREKGYIEFLEMASLLAAEYANVTFLVVGDSLPSDRDQFAPEFRRRLESLGLGNRFIMTGQVEDVERFLGKMDVFVLPSYREGFPRSILEAMACGLPVVASRIRGCREAVIDGVTGMLVPSRDVTALTHAVRQMIESPVLRTQMGQAGRARVCALFDEKAVSHRYVKELQLALCR